VKSIFDKINRYHGGAWGTGGDATVGYPSTPISAAATSQSITAGTAYYNIYSLVNPTSVISSLEFFITVSDASSVWHQSIYTWASSGVITLLGTVSFADTGSAAGFRKLNFANPINVRGDRVFISTLIVGGAARLSARSSTLLTDTQSFSGATGLSTPPATDSTARTAVNWQPYIYLR
jgi:hypothetical protein